MIILIIYMLNISVLCIVYSIGILCKPPPPKLRPFHDPWPPSPPNPPLSSHSVPMAAWRGVVSYSVMLILYCTPTSQILRKMALMANQHDGIWKGGGTQPLVQKSSPRWRSFSYLLSLISYLLSHISYLLSLISYLLTLSSSYLQMALVYKKLPIGVPFNSPA